MNTILIGKRLNVFPLKSGTRQRYLLLPLRLNVVCGVLSKVVGQRKKEGRKKWGKEETKEEKKEGMSSNEKGKEKSPLFTYNMKLHAEFAKGSTKYVLEQIKGFSKQSGYSVSTQIPLVFLYTVMV